MSRTIRTTSAVATALALCGLLSLAMAGTASAKPKCGGKKATIVGTKGNDKIKVKGNGHGVQVVVGLGGSDDVINGMGGDDGVRGDAGSDSLFGEQGFDVVDALDGAKDKVLSCGPGGGRLLRDGSDPKGSGCGK
ncbi:MAG: hypothetical protein EXQ70_10100 [Solirubrobacterales bacterium]|nr:hypothetical protein [Solirubrobacterales bacterium]